MRKKTLATTLLGLFLLGVAAVPAAAEVKLPGVFGDRMVVQRDAALAVWGWAEPGEKVTVTLSDRAESAIAGPNGKWRVKLDALEAGGPHKLTVKGNNTIELSDVLIGEVWLCSGQSNMAMSVRGCKDYEREQAAAKLPQIRMMTVPRVPAVEPQDDCQGEWVACSPETVGGFSATAYFFGRKLHKDLDVPVGLINSSWGGTPVQAWTSLEAQQAVGAIKPLLDEWEQKTADYDPQEALRQFEQQMAKWKERAKKAKAEGKKPPRPPRKPGDPRLNSHYPSALYNGMIAPLRPYAIRGAIWYQGESNAGRYNPGLYGTQLATMIENWRADWPDSALPFLWVQLPNFKAPQQEPVQTDGWVIVQEGMLKTLKVENTGMAVTIDLGEANNIHPKNKQDVGKRLALWALGTTYGKDIVYSGPIYKSMENSGGKIVVKFDRVGGAPLAGDGEKLKGFAVAGADKKFVWADAKIDGDTVIVSSPEVDKPVAVRYAWAPNPDCNLRNTAGLPASPFRTDDWEQ